MGEGRVKTALELAMEKVAAMPKLDTEDLREERRKEAIAKGEAAAMKFLQNQHRKTDIKAEISAVEEEWREHARQTALQCLAREMGLTQPEFNLHILEGMARLNPGISVDTARKKIDAIINSFIAEVKKAQSKVEKTELERLKSEGISGSAVRLNLKTTSGWQETYAGLSARFTGKLYEFQQSLPNA